MCVVPSAVGVSSDVIFFIIMNTLIKAHIMNQKTKHFHTVTYTVNAGFAAHTHTLTEETAIQ